MVFYIAMKTVQSAVKTQQGTKSLLESRFSFTGEMCSFYNLSVENGYDRPFLEIKKKCILQV